MTPARKKILLWYQKNRRDFPWRHKTTPYRIMIAEFMLQRTRAEQVAPVYREFIRKYPDIKSLYVAKIGNIRKFTGHLGIHWRAGHFIKAAKYIVRNFNGRLPAAPEKLLQIPGIGNYVAGAMLTVCFKKKYPVIDSNIARFINRFYGLGMNGEIRRKKEIINIASELFNTTNPGKLLFAIIDFTALVCRPGKPLCAGCILRQRCRFRPKNR